MALLFAKAAGAEVFVSSSSDEKIERAIALGASDGLRYDQPEWWKKAQKMSPSGFNVIIDSAGGDDFGGLVRILSMGARLVFFGGTCGKWPAILPQYLFFRQVSILASTMGSREEFSDMLGFISTHQLVPTVDSCFPLEEAVDALKQLAVKERFGKVCLSVAST